ncbi:DUF202 domain-containing protein [Candidatus Woesebacteria bacterium]|nr:MAG: DUF202 domain-containing protein [Candidatus Woesebacteria bacterium]
MNALNHVSTNNEIILRDQLALERTAMANERTLLAYIKTMVGSMAVGVTFLKLFEGPVFYFGGFALIFLGISLLIIGFARFFKVERLLTEIFSPEIHQSSRRKIHNYNKRHFMLFHVHNT